MKNLFNLDDLSVNEITEILECAEQFKNGKVSNLLKGKKVVNLFFEPSTRTCYSFISAEENLDMKVTNFILETSSVRKGETLYDTAKTFESIGFDCLVIRHPRVNYYKELTNINVPILSGGDGTGAHPTQSLLDLFTIKQEFAKFEGLKIAICGDIMHSRVAHTNIKIMKRLGMKVFISGPEEFNDNSSEYINFNEAIEQMDIIMMLRVQYERHDDKIKLSNDSYLHEYGLTMDSVLRMKKEAIIMHPAPLNRGTEIADDVVECEKSRIFKQMKNGVYVRMAVLERAFI